MEKEMMKTTKTTAGADVRTGNIFKAEDLSDDGIRNLTVAVLRQAINDWIRAKKRLLKDPGNTFAKATVDQVETFILEDMTEVYPYTPDPDALMSQMYRYIADYGCVRLKSTSGTNECEADAAAAAAAMSAMA